MNKMKIQICLLLSIALVMMPLAAFATEAEQDYELRVLSFEGGSWDSLIDDPQQYGPLLYGENNAGFSRYEDAYKWSDETTKLSSRLCNAYNTYAFYSGGHAISNYAASDYLEYGTFMHQLTVYDADATGLVRSGGGHDGSDNFAIHFGYMDGSPYNKTEELPALTFSDGTARVVDHMYVNITAYVLNCLLNGNELTEAGGTFWLKAIGFNGEERTGEVVFAMSDGESEIVTNWRKWDLSGLGKVTSIQFNVGGSADNGYGFSQPAYFAYDDVAVRFETVVENVAGDLTGDGMLDATDAVLVLQAVAGAALSEEQISVADMNNDTQIDANDAVLILQKAAE